MTKIMAVGDFHGDQLFAKQLAKKAIEENVEIIILAGDITLANLDIKNLIGPFAKKEKRILLIPGNHETPETTEFLSRMYAPYTHHLHGNHFQKNNIGFFGAGTANMGPGQIPDSMIFELLEKSHEKIKDLDHKIMVTHIHPKDSKSELTGFRGSPAVKEAILKFKPKIAICSHIHEAAGLEEKIGETLVINVSKKEFIFEF